jgi:hypothetical protein
MDNVVGANGVECFFYYIFKKYCNSCDVNSYIPPCMNSIATKLRRRGVL